LSMLITIFATRIIFYSISILIGYCMEKIQDLTIWKKRIWV